MACLACLVWFGLFVHLFGWFVCFVWLVCLFGLFCLCVCVCLFVCLSVCLFVCLTSRIGIQNCARPPPAAAMAAALRAVFLLVYTGRIRCSTCCSSARRASMRVHSLFCLFVVLLLCVVCLFNFCLVVSVCLFVCLNVCLYP